MLGVISVIIDLSRLNTGVVEYIDINEECQFSEEQLRNSGILDLKDTKVIGSISREGNNHYLECSINGIMVVPCSLTLKPVDYLFDIKVEGILEDLFEEIGEIIKNNQNTIDILPIIWENILMEIPMKVVSDQTDDVKASGNGWRLITEEEENIKEINPELEKLKDLL